MTREKDKFSGELAYFKNLSLHLVFYGLCILYE